MPIKLSHGVAGIFKELFCIINSALSVTEMQAGGKWRERLFMCHLSSWKSSPGNDWLAAWTRSVGTEAGSSTPVDLLGSSACSTRPRKGQVTAATHYHGSHHSQVRKGSLLFSADSTSLKRGIRSSDSKVPRSTLVPGRQSRKSGKRVCWGLTAIGVWPAFSPVIEGQLLLPS